MRSFLFTILLIFSFTVKGQVDLIFSGGQINYLSQLELFQKLDVKSIKHSKYESTHFTYTDTTISIKDIIGSFNIDIIYFFEDGQLDSIYYREYFEYSKDTAVFYSSGLLYEKGNLMKELIYDLDTLQSVYHYKYNSKNLIDTVGIYISNWNSYSKIEYEKPTFRKYKVIRYDSLDRIVQFDKEYFSYNSQNYPSKSKSDTAYTRSGCVVDRSKKYFSVSEYKYYKNGLFKRDESITYVIKNNLVKKHRKEKYRKKKYRFY